MSRARTSGLTPTVGNPWLKIVVFFIGVFVLAAFLATALFPQIQMWNVWWFAYRQGGSATFGDDPEILWLELQVGVVGMIFTVVIGFIAFLLFYLWWRRI